MRTRRWIALVVGVLALAGALSVFAPEKEAEASLTSEKTKDLVSFVKGDAALNLRLMALDALRKRNDQECAVELTKLVGEKDLRIAIAAATALGKRKTKVARSRLKILLGNEKKKGKRIEVEKALMAVIAAHWKDKRDLTYLKSHSKDDAKLRSFCAWLESKYYGK